MTAVDEFLLSISMHPDLTDISEVCRCFREEMELGLAGKPSSLQMIPTYISAHGKPESNKPVIAIDAGGTNLRVGLVTFADDKPVILSMEKSAMPGSLGEISADEFFDILAEKVLPLTGESSKIAFCFSYPAEIFPNHDGKILQLNKELRIKDARGLLLGQELLKKLKEKCGKGDWDFTVLNDTAAGLMGGIASLGLDEYDGIAGLILGTGNNSCYLEKGSKIKKIPGARDMIINCESGIFNRALRGISDFMVDEASDIPGDHQLEKMMGGAYHGRVISNTAVLASKAGLLSKKFENLTQPFTSQQLDSFLRGETNPVDALCSGADAENMRIIIDRSFQRAAKLVCANIAALCLHCDGGKVPENPFYVVAEGSSFHNSLLFSAKLDKYMKSYIKEKLNRNVCIVRAENSTLAGAALAALLN